MIEDKIKIYMEDIALAQKLRENEYTDKEHYDKIIDKNEKLLKFYEELQLYVIINQNYQY